MISSHDVVFNPFTLSIIQMKAGRLCRQTSFSPSDYDDLVQGMRLCLIRKVHLFNPLRGNFQSFVTKVINSWAAMELRYRNRQKRSEGYKTVSLDRAKVEVEGSTVTLGAVLLEEDGGRRTQTYPLLRLEHFELSEAIEYVMDNLEPYERALLTEVAEYGVAHAAKSRGISRRKVNHMLSSIRTFFEKAGLGRN